MAIDKVHNQGISLAWVYTLSPIATIGIDYYIKESIMRKLKKTSLKRTSDSLRDMEEIINKIEHCYKTAMICLKTLKEQHKNAQLELSK